MQAAHQREGTRDAGTFGLILEVASEHRTEVGSLGPIRFPEGVYAYAGQSKRGFGDRVDRLVDGESRARRHVDRVAPAVEARGAVRFPGDLDACDLSTHLARAPGSLPVIGFGATGCTCLTHLHGFLEGDVPEVRDALEAWTGAEG